MIVSTFLLWAREASPGHRAEAVGALARAYLYSDLSPADRQEARTALVALLDDPSALVRRAMAEVLAAHEDAPRPVIVALADDGDDIAEIVLARSPLLSDADLVDRAALGDERLQCAIASRLSVSAAVSAALAEIGTAGGLVALARNPGAHISPASLARIVERHGGSGLLRETLLMRPDLPVEITQAVVAALAESLRGFVTECGWLNAERSGRVTREARERTTVALSARTDEVDAVRLVGHLRRTGQLTPALLLRAILSRTAAFGEAAFSDLSGFTYAKTAAILREPLAPAFRALYGRAGLPAGLLPAFEAALSARRRDDGLSGTAGRLSVVMVASALSACEALPPEEAGRLVALFRRFEAEAARDEARRAAFGLADRAALILVQHHAPEALLPAPDTEAA